MRITTTVIDLRIYFHKACEGDSAFGRPWQWTSCEDCVFDQVCLLSHATRSLSWVILEFHLLWWLIQQCTYRALVIITDSKLHYCSYWLHRDYTVLPLNSLNFVEQVNITFNFKFNFSAKHQTPLQLIKVFAYEIVFMVIKMLKCPWNVNICS